MKRIFVVVLAASIICFLVADFDSGTDLASSRPLVTSYPPAMSSSAAEPERTMNPQEVEELAYGLQDFWAGTGSELAKVLSRGSKMASSATSEPKSVEDADVPPLNDRSLSWLWMGWTHCESGEDSWELTASDGGHAYGRYQFDDRHCLADFMRFCVEEDRDNFESFTTFYHVDSKGKAHIKNTERLPKEWNWICYTKGETFYDMQTRFALEAYYEPAKKTLEKRCKVDLDSDYGPVLHGTLLSLAIRNGTYASGLTSIIDTYYKGINEREWLEEIYAAEAAHHPDQVSRWGTEQKKMALEALKALGRIKLTEKGIKKLETKYGFEPIL